MKLKFSKCKQIASAAICLTLFYGCEKDSKSYANYTPTEKSPLITTYGETAPSRLNVTGDWKCVNYIRKEYDDESMTTPTDPLSYQLENILAYWTFSDDLNIVTIKRTDNSIYGASSYAYSNTENNTLTIRSYIKTDNQQLPDVEYKTENIGENNIQVITTKPYKTTSIDATQQGKVVYAYDSFQLVKVIQ